MPSPAYERLSGLDTSFLLLESRNVYSHVASTLVFDAGPLRRADGGIDFDAIVEAHRALLPRIPRYRQVLRFTPVTGQPVWVDDARFDLSYHLRHTSLPKPGTDEQLKQLSARIMQQHLDRSRPLWETWVVEGLEGGRFAVIAKVHHCMIDGIAGVDLMQLLLSPDPRSPAPEPAPRYEPRPEPTSLQLLRDDLARRARIPLTALHDMREFLQEAEDVRHEVVARATGALTTLGATVRRPSETPLNQPIGAHRRFDWCSMDLAEIRDVKNRLGGTVNDVVLAIATGAFRRFLQGRGIRLARDLDFRVLAPVSVRRPEEREALGNRISGWIVRLPLDGRDPKRRLQRIAEQTRSLKASKLALGAELLINVVDWTPATLLSLGARGIASLLPFNSIVTNVPGPQVPMYLCGARLLEAFPHAPLIDRVGLGIALMSYDGRLHWGINADYDAVPDVEVFRDAIEASFEELRRAARVDRKPRKETRPSERPLGAPKSSHPNDERHARRIELTDLARTRHDALTAAIEQLEHALAAAAAGRAKPWSERVATELDRVRTAIDAHVESIEESEGLFEEVRLEKPRLGMRIAALEQEHKSIQARATELAERVPGDDEADFAALRVEVTDLLALLRRHRAAEADLVFEAFWTDLGAGD